MMWLMVLSIITLGALTVIILSGMWLQEEHLKRFKAIDEALNNIAQTQIDDHNNVRTSMLGIMGGKTDAMGTKLNELIDLLNNQNQLEKERWGVFQKRNKITSDLLLGKFDDSESILAVTEEGVETDATTH